LPDWPRKRFQILTMRKEGYYLDALVDVRVHKKKMVEALDRQREEKMIGYDPFGKPGAGAPNRDEKGGFFIAVNLTSHLGFVILFSEASLSTIFHN